MGKKSRRKIKKLRADLNRMTQLQQGNKSRRLKNHCQRIKKEYAQHNKHERDNIKNEEIIDNKTKAKSPGRKTTKV